MLQIFFEEFDFEHPTTRLSLARSNCVLSVSLHVFSPPQRGGNQLLDHERSFQVVSQLAIVMPRAHSRDDSKFLGPVFHGGNSFSLFHEQATIALHYIHPTQIQTHTSKANFVSRPCMPNAKDVVFQSFPAPSESAWHHSGGRC